MAREEDGLVPRVDERLPGVERHGLDARLGRAARYERRLGIAVPDDARAARPILPAQEDPDVGKGAESAERARVAARHRVRQLREEVDRIRREARREPIAKSQNRELRQTMRPAHRLKLGSHSIFFCA